MGGVKSLILLHLIYLSTCMDQLHIRYEWNQIDYQFPSPEDRQLAIENRTFIPENNVPMGIEVWGDKLFITILRWKPGVPSSLNYINLNDTSKSPKLIPYPNWAAHSDDAHRRREIIAPQGMRIDRCSRLWIMDNAKVVEENENITFERNIIVFDLKTDLVLRKYLLPEYQAESFRDFANIVVEDTECEDTFAYVADHQKGAILVYSWKKNESWLITHEFFNIDPIARDFRINGFKFSRSDAVFGLSISGPNPNNFSTLYFHPITSFEEFSVSTEYLRNKSTVANNPDVFKRLGSRGSNSQAFASFIDKKTGVLFYSLVNLNAVACWKTSNKDYSMVNQGRIYMNNETMIMPSDIKVDYNDNLWVISNKLYIYMYRKLDLNEVNFRIFTAPVMEAISHTACDIILRTDILEKYLNNTKNSSSTLVSTSAVIKRILVSLLVLLFAFLRI